MADEALRRSGYLTGAVVEAPVGLVIVSTPTRRNVMTVSLFSEVAHHPTSLWIAVAPATLTAELLDQVGHFSLITLHSGQAGIAAACGTVSGRERDKCAGLDLYDDGGGFLFLRDALASTACRVTRRHQVGDHQLIIADILSGDVSPRRTARRQLLLSDLRRS